MVEMPFGDKFHALVVFPGSGRVQLPQFRVFLPFLMQRTHRFAQFADIEVKVAGAALSRCSFTTHVKIVTSLPDNSSPCGETFTLLITGSHTQKRKK